jgi:hypothetical protein
MTNIFGDCESIVTDAKIVFKEKRSRIEFVNRKKKTVSKIEIDGCHIQRGLRCDWLMITQDGTEFFIELKGSDVNHALKQIKATIKKVSTDIRNTPKRSYIIAYHCRIPIVTIQNQQKIFKKVFNSDLFVKGPNHSEQI